MKDIKMQNTGYKPKLLIHKLQKVEYLSKNIHVINTGKKKKMIN